MRRTLRLALVAASSVFAVSASAEPASADAAGASFRGCAVQIGELSVPSNAPALVVHDTSAGATATVSAELITEGGPIALGAPTKEASGMTIMSLPSVPAGSYEVSTTVRCSDGTPETVQTSSLTLTAPVAFPSDVGTLGVRPNPSPTGTDTIELTPSAGLRAFRQVAVLRMSVNDQSPLAGSSATTTGVGAPITFTAPTGSVCVENGALHREKRTMRVTIAASIAGVAEYPRAATIEVPVDCGAITWTGNAFGPGSPAMPIEGDASGTPSSGAGGCSAVPVGRLGTGHAALAAIALALVGSYRRRRRSA
jgi:MYXO-CTERM domain-containing protein